MALRRQIMREDRFISYQGYLGFFLPFLYINCRVDHVYFVYEVPKLTNRGAGTSQLKDLHDLTVNRREIPLLLLQLDSYAGCSLRSTCNRV